MYRLQKYKIRSTNRTKENSSDSNFDATSIIIYKKKKEISNNKFSICIWIKMHNY
jgi:hypothetical protein